MADPKEIRLSLLAGGVNVISQLYSLVANSGLLSCGEHAT